MYFTPSEMKMRLSLLQLCQWINMPVGDVSETPTTALFEEIHEYAKAKGFIIDLKKRM